MVTREDLKGYRDTEREARETLARMRQAELAAKNSDRERDRRRAARLAKQYEQIAAARDKETKRIVAEVSAIHRAKVRQVLTHRYIEGWSRTKTAVMMGISEAYVAKLTKQGISLLSSREKK